MPLHPATKSAILKQRLAAPSVTSPWLVCMICEESMEDLTEARVHCDHALVSPVCVDCLAGCSRYMLGGVFRCPICARDLTSHVSLLRDMSSSSSTGDESSSQDETDIVRRKAPYNMYPGPRLLLFLQAKYYTFWLLIVVIVLKCAGVGLHWNSWIGYLSCIFLATGLGFAAQAIAERNVMGVTTCAYWMLLYVVAPVRDRLKYDGVFSTSPSHPLLHTQPTSLYSGGDVRPAVLVKWVPVLWVCVCGVMFAATFNWWFIWSFDAAVRLAEISLLCVLVMLPTVRCVRWATGTHSIRAAQD